MKKSSNEVWQICFDKTLLDNIMNAHPERKHRPRTWWIAVGSLCPWVCVLAQAVDQPSTTYPAVEIKAAPLEYRQFGKVELTGSSIVRKEQTQTLPVQIITRAEIARSGKQNLADYLQTLPVIFNSFSAPLLGAVQSGFSGAAIHGLQIGTLVLVNGRRLAGFGRQTSFGQDNGGVDVNTLPLSAIERVEILTDGASSTYGSDAQSGVINIITRSEQRGTEITVDHRIPDGHKGLSSRVDLSMGKGRLAQDGYRLFVAADVQDQQELLGRDRPYASAGRYPLQQNGQSYWLYGAGLTAAQSGATLATSKTEPWTRLWNADYQNGQCPDAKVPALGQPACLSNTYLDKGLYPASRTARLHAQGQLKLNADMMAYAELSWKQEEQKRSNNVWGQYSAKIGNSPQSPGYALAASNGFDPASGTWLLYNGSDLGVTNRWFGLQTRRLVAGVKGLWRDWDVDAGYYFSDNHASFDSDRFTLYPNLGVGSNQVLINPALLSPLTDNSPASLLLRQQLMGMVIPRVPYNDGTNSIQGVGFKGSRSVGEFDGREVLLAVGTDWRQETAKFNRYQAGIPSYQGQRTVWAQFAEIQMPLFHNAEALAAIRNDQYSVFGNTTHGKLSAKWAPGDQWLLRGAWGTGFRAPAIAQMQETGKNLVSTFSSNCTAELQAVASSMGGVCPLNGLYNIYSQGSSKLKPELSTQWNAGIRFSPDRNHTISVDYWRIDMRNKISNLYGGFPFANPSNYMSNFELNENKELQVFTPMVNIGKTQLSGIDFSWSLRQPTDWGQFQWGVNGTWTLKSRYQRADGQPFESDLNVDSVYSGVVVPKLRTRWYVGLQQAQWQWLATVNYISGHDTLPFEATKADTGQVVVVDNYRVPAWWTVDLMVRHQWTPQTSVKFGIENALNRKAPLDIAYSTSFNFGTNPLLANVWGRTVNLSVTHRF